METGDDARSLGKVPGGGKWSTVKLVLQPMKKKVNSDINSE